MLNRKWGREGGRKLNRGLIARETKDGCAILTVETEVNGDSKSTNERGPSLVGSLGLDICLALVALVGPVQNIFFLTIHNFKSLSPSPSSWAGSRAGSPIS